MVCIYVDDSIGVGTNL